MEEQLPFLLEVRGYLSRNWHKLGFTNSPLDLAYRIRYASKGNPLSKNQMVALWFKDNPEEVQVVTKWTPGPHHARLTVQEYQYARQLYQSLQRRYIPKPLDCPEILGIPVIIQEAVPGRSFAHQLMSFTKDSNPAPLFEKAGEMLTQIQRPFQPVSKEGILKHLEPAVTHIEKTLTWDISKAKIVREALVTMISDPVPGSSQTLLVGDFSPANILDGPKGTFLIDLAGAHESPLAFIDPLTFVYGFQALEGKDALEKECRDFLECRGLSKKHMAWYWLVFFIYTLNKMLSPIIKDGADSPEDIPSLEIIKRLDAQITEFINYPQVFPLTNSKSLV